MVHKPSVAPAPTATEEATSLTGALAAASQAVQAVLTAVSLPLRHPFWQRRPVVCAGPWHLSDRFHPLVHRWVSHIYMCG